MAVDMFIKMGDKIKGEAKLGMRIVQVKYHCRLSPRRSSLRLAEGIDAAIS